MGPALAAAVAGSVAIAGWRAHALTGDGAAAAATVGTAILVAAGWPGGAVVLVFFLSSTAISRLADLRAPPQDHRGNRRDLRQVYANGGAAAAGALAASADPRLALWIATAAMAAAGADTWATSVGAFSPGLPRDVLTGIPVPAGTSGGITWAGTLGAAVGALLISLPAAFTGHTVLLPVGAIIGVGGMLVDSVLGARFQARFRCPMCGTPCESPRHACGTLTRHERGWRWLTNDGVNAAATSAAALAGWAAWGWLSRWP